MIDLSPYQGRWVAISDAEVIAVDDTADGAYYSALDRDPGESFYLNFVEGEVGKKLPFTSLLEEVRPFFERRGMPVYLVGGAVRDALLERTSKDLDFIVPRDAVSLAFRLGDAIGAPAYVLDEERDTGRIVLAAENTMLDFARYRDVDLFADLRDRDFTINAMAMPATAGTNKAIIDPLNGLADLQAGLVRLTRADALESDPVRALRAVRIAAYLGYAITAETQQAVRDAAPGLQESSAERVRDELIKIIQTPLADVALEQMNDLGLLNVVLPELAALEGVQQSEPHHEPVLKHTGSVLRWLEKVEKALFEDEVADPALETARSILAPHLEELGSYLKRPVDGGLNGRDVLRLAALFHDVGKRVTQSIDDDGRYRFFGHAEVGAEMADSRLRALCLSKDARTQIVRIVREHMRPLLLTQSLGAQPSRRAAYRYFKAASANGLDVGLLALADHLATYDGPGEEAVWSDLLALVSALFDYYFDHHEEAVKPPALVNGHDLMDYLDLSPGPEIGRILALIEENQAAGEITTREEALVFARSL
ncbi:MAG: CCA tRNA nucleotidyltransferase [Candidatus Promineifilaceae bacterium]